MRRQRSAVPGAAEFLTGIPEKGLPLVLLTTTRRKPADLANRFCYRWR